MAAALLSSLASALIHSFPNPNRLHSSILLIRTKPFSPSRLISCSAADPHLSSLYKLGSSTQRHRISFGSRSPFLLHADRKIKTLSTSPFHGDQQHQQQQSSVHGHQQHSPAIVSCSFQKNSIYQLEGDDKIYIDDDEIFNSILHFSTFDSDGALLNRFAKPLIGRKEHGHKPFVLSACRDLVLLRDHDAFLCNLTTQELISVPNIDDELQSCTVREFGYVASTEEFKLLAKDGPGYKVLTLGVDHQWRDAGIPPLPKDLIFMRHAFVNGAIHVQSVVSDRIAIFDLEREEWRSIAGPPVSPRYLYLSLEELSGYLCVADSKPGYGICIWVLDYNNDGSWVKACTIHYSVWNAEAPYKVEPLTIENDGRILVLVHHLNKTNSLELYDPKTISTQEIYRSDTPDGYGQFFVKFFRPWGIGERLNSVPHMKNSLSLLRLGYF